MALLKFKLEKLHCDATKGHIEILRKRNKALFCTVLWPHSIAFAINCRPKIKIKIYVLCKKCISALKNHKGNVHYWNKKCFHTKSVFLNRMYDKKQIQCE